MIRAATIRAAVWACIGLLWLPVGVTLSLLAMPAIGANSAAVIATLAGGPEVGAATVPAAAALAMSPWLVAGVSWILSSLSGVTALLLRIDAALTATPDRPLPRPLLFCAAHMAGSWLAGVLAYLIGHTSDTWQLFAGVICASFVGAKFVESAAEKLFPRLPGASPATPER